jgi:tetratricopeptide (TPR) repeat protein
LSRLATLLVAAPLLLAGPVAADEGAPARNEQARAHFLAGQTAYRAARYTEALAEFQAGYELSPRAAFLLNLAQTERRLGHYEAAIARCEAFLAVESDTPLAQQARELDAALKAEREAARKSGRLVAPPPPMDPYHDLAPVPSFPPAQPVPSAPPPMPAVQTQHRSVGWPIAIAAIVVGGLVLVGAFVAVMVLAVEQLGPNEPALPLASAR